MDFPHPTEIKAKRIRLLAVLSCILGLIGFVVYLCWPKEPMYHFRTLTSWLEDYSNPLRGVHSLQEMRNMDVRDRQSKASEAVLAIGTNAIPTLVKYAGTRSVRIDPANIGSDDVSPTVRSTSAPSDKRDLARAGFMILQAHAAPAIPELLKLTHDQDAGVRMFASESIIMVAGTDPKVIIPMYVQFGHDPDAHNRQAAASFLRVMLSMADESQKAAIYEAFPELRLQGSTATP